jgi:DNA invertase Pin-like site-specific DNA recombinase
MMKAVNAREFDMVATWSVDRLGRSLTDLLGVLQDLQEKGVDLFLHQQGLDTSTTAGTAMFQIGRICRI